MRPNKTKETEQQFIHAWFSVWWDAMTSIYIHVGNDRRHCESGGYNPPPKQSKQKHVQLIKKTNQ